MGRPLSLKDLYNDSVAKEVVTKAYCFERTKGFVFSHPKFNIFYRKATCVKHCFYSQIFPICYFHYNDQKWKQFDVSVRKASFSNLLDFSVVSSRNKIILSVFVRMASFQSSSVFKFSCSFFCYNPNRLKRKRFCCSLKG